MSDDVNLCPICETPMKSQEEYSECQNRICPAFLDEIETGLLSALQKNRMDLNAEADALRAEIERLKKEYNDEISEVNMGHDAFMAGVPIDDEPIGLKHDVWRMGWLWAQYIKTTSPQSPTPAATPETPELTPYAKRMIAEANAAKAAPDERDGKNA